ncbi:putative ubiquitin carboxyl-terminal hydrolase 11 [Diplonema papillatum]|nr:putative ubiquitin carboxyl-terminal hydrolase 11 [Diplonema papillatum]
MSGLPSSPGAGPRPLDAVRPASPLTKATSAVRTRAVNGAVPLSSPRLRGGHNVRSSPVLQPTRRVSVGSCKSYITASSSEDSGSPRAIPAEPVFTPLHYNQRPAPLPTSRGNLGFQRLPPVSAHTRSTASPSPPHNPSSPPRSPPRVTPSGRNSSPQIGGVAISSTATLPIIEGWLEKPKSLLPSYKKHTAYYFSIDSHSIRYSKDLAGKKWKTYPIKGARVDFVSTKKVMILDMMAPRGRKKMELMVAGGRSADIEKWAQEFSGAIRRQTSGIIRSMSIRGHCVGFDALLENYGKYANDVIVFDSDAADISGLAQVAQHLADPSQLALSKLKDQPTTSGFLSETLASIWEHFDTDRDGSLNPTECENLVRAYLASVQRYMPQLVDSIITRVLQLFMPGKTEKSKDIVDAVAALKEQAVDTTFFDELHKDIPSIAKEMWSKMDVNRDGRVEKAEFVNTFLECSEISDLGSAIQGRIGDDIARQMKTLLDKHMKQKPGTCGLKNLGNTCYMNSALQCLSATVRLRQFFISGKYRAHVNTENKLGTKGKLVEAFAELMRQMWQTSSTSYAPGSFKKELGKCNEQFAGWGQEDSQEFVSFLLDRMHEDLNKVSKKHYVELKDPPNFTEEQLARMWWEYHLKQNLSFVVSLFHGQLRSIVTCLSCGHVSKAFDPMMYLSLPLPDKTRGGKLDLSSCFDTYMDLEEVKGQNEWYCSKCKKHRPFRKEVALWKLPAYLIIHLKRFKYSLYGTVTSKITTPVDFPTSFSPARWLARSMSDTISRTPPDKDLSEATLIPYLSPRTGNLCVFVTTSAHLKN